LSVLWNGSGSNVGSASYLPSRTGSSARDDEREDTGVPLLNGDREHHNPTPREQQE
jgi:hypothetical protein